jgi:U11/U12 small nuclear ribonucleoprotein SNRNP35
LPLIHVLPPLLTFPAAGSIDCTDETPHDKAIKRAAEKSYCAILPSVYTSINVDALRHFHLPATDDPDRDPKIKGDPHLTLFVGRLSYETTEATLRKFFEKYGRVKNVTLVRDIGTSPVLSSASFPFLSSPLLGFSFPLSLPSNKRFCICIALTVSSFGLNCSVTGASRGYAFVEFEDHRAFQEAFRFAHRQEIDGHQILVDYERERLMEGWIPRRYACLLYLAALLLY